MAGIIPALIQTAIKAPIRIKMKIGMMAVPIPSWIPWWISSQEAPRKRAQKMSRAIVNRTGIWGDRPNLMTAVHKIINIIIRIIMASLKYTFFIT